MTRVPKFRAWDVDDEKMYLWEDVIFDKQKGDDFVSFGYEEGIVTSYDHEQIVMQSTGLKDCNDVEIYEGDFVTASGYEYMGVGVVRYEESLAGFVVDFTNRLLQEKPQFIYQYGELEAIGNVYENKELLE